jgi:hypothetical protein
MILVVSAKISAVLVSCISIIQYIKAGFTEVYAKPIVFLINMACFS